MKIKITYLFSLSLILTSNLSFAQISFGGFGNQYSSTGAYGTSIMELTDGTLDFQLLLNNEGNVSIPLLDAETLEFELSGVKFLDLFVTVSADVNMETAGCVTSSCQLPFTLGASFANRGSNLKSQATSITIDPTNNGDAVFPIRYRGNVPPGPPPTPFYEGYVPETDEAYLYIYGSVNVGTQDSGVYTGNITITVNYD